MSHPRYQIFVSSTFQDLQEERQAVLNAILKLNQFPAGMEIFPAANDTPWELIQEIIKDSDYYVLIIRGKYGSMDVDGISFTEREYDFAVSQKIPVLAFIHDDPENIPVGKTEENKKIRKKLEDFKQKVEKHHRKPWKTIDELKEGVLVSLMWSFNTNPQTGWVKADGIDNKDLLVRLAELQQKYDNLAEENSELQERATSFNKEQFAYGEEIVSLTIRYGEPKIELKFEITWNEIFSCVGEHIVAKALVYDVERNLSWCLVQYFKNSKEYLSFKATFENEAEMSRSLAGLPFALSHDSFKIIENQFLALDLIEVSEIPMTGTRSFPGTGGVSTTLAWTWQLSEKGKRLFLSKKAISKIKS